MAEQVRRIVLAVSALLGAALAALCLAAPAGAYIYWVNTNSIGRANLDGSGVDQNFIAVANNAQCGIAVDAAHIYWTYGSGAIARANIDGSGMNLSFITGGSTVCGVGVDAGHVYWGNQATNAIGRANLDGSGVNQRFITNATGACGPASDGAHLYWGNYGALSGAGQGNGTTIGRADLDAAGNPSNIRQNFITGASGPCFIALDAGHVYWENIGPGGGTGIGRANLDGSGADQSFLTVPNGPCGLAIDATYAYWARLAGGAGTQVGRASLDGNLIQPSFIMGAAEPCGVAIDAQPVTAPPPGPAPSNHFSLGKVKRNERNGTAVLILELPGPGTLLVGGKDVNVLKHSAGTKRARQLTIAAAGSVKIVIGAKGKAGRKLHRRGKAKVKVALTYTPTGGTASRQVKPLKLIRRR